MLIKDIEFDIRPITRRQRKDLLNKHGIDLLKLVNGMVSQSNNIEVKTLDAVLDTCFPNRDADFDRIGLTGQIDLFSQIIAVTCGIDTTEEIKN